MLYYDKNYVHEEIKLFHSSKTVCNSLFIGRDCCFFVWGIWLLGIAEAMKKQLEIKKNQTSVGKGKMNADHTTKK